MQSYKGLSDFRWGSGEGSGSHRPSGIVTVVRLAVTVLPASWEAGRKGRQHDPGLPRMRLS